jgi:hypothetical protein
VFFFALALAPGGNVAASLRSWARRVGDGTRCLEEGLPAGIYLGYYRGKASDTMAKAFKEDAASLFAALPSALHLDHLIEGPGGWYLAAGEDLGPATEAATVLARKLGLEPLSDPPLNAGAGYFAGKHVTTTDAESFSFRHLDALLLRVELSSGPPCALAWTMVCRARRLVGPRRAPLR